MPKDPKELGDEILGRLKAAGMEMPPPDARAANIESAEAMMAEQDESNRQGSLFAGTADPARR